MTLDVVTRERRLVKQIPSLQNLWVTRGEGGVIWAVELSYLGCPPLDAQPLPRVCPHLVRMQVLDCTVLFWLSPLSPGPTSPYQLIFKIFF